MRKQILNQPIDIMSINEATYLAKMAFVNPKQLRIITLNPEMLVNAHHNFELQAAINNSDLILPDGIGIVWALKLLNPTEYEELERIPGIELAENILACANELSKKVAIFGGTKEVLEGAVNVIKEKYLNLQIVKAIDGYQENEKEVADKIAFEKPDLVLIALGTPKQEIWINNYAELFQRSIIISIGGSLDVWSGKKLRAPEIVRNYHLEWLFRLITEPKRIVRILKTLPEFVWMVILTRTQKI